MANPDEARRREKLAREAIARAFGTEADEYGATLFVSHHLDEIEGTYWQKHLGTSRPQPQRVLELLVLKSHWGETDDGIDTFDFTLPDDVTNYVVSVRFRKDGQVDDISMES